MITVNDFKLAKGVRKLTQITAYDYSSAKLADEVVDSILVGDSLGMTMLGYPNTLAVTVDDMIHHGAAVVRGARNALVVVDMPFMSYQVSVEDAVKNAGRIMKETGCAAVKIEGGRKYADRIKAIVEAGIPVVGHVGLTPQSVNAFGGFKLQAKTKESAKELILDCKALEEAGCFAVTLECVPEKLAAYITSILNITTIGIGASNACDAQVLVWHDLLGYSNDKGAKFVKKYLNMHDLAVEAISNYKNEVESQAYPAPEHIYKTGEAEVIEAIEEFKKEN